ncbi:MAG TPA: HPr family phosphocarrier protein [Candidatus Limnocylindria bacterium]|jgi:phosphotransferase system HPr (HPr) family protein|nr:HPr family phosphocarrier protein [Candidatus Limnocylindria bacterium]
MKTATVTVSWLEGLHLRPAASLVRLTRQFCSEIIFCYGDAVADARSVLSIILLGAVSGTEVSIQASGPDEHEAIVALRNFFATDWRGAAALGGIGDPSAARLGV